MTMDVQQLLLALLVMLLILKPSAEQQVSFCVFLENILYSIPLGNVK